jgi:uncharacterized membrane protein YtjA (UPF0391 family)
MECIRISPCRWPQKKSNPSAGALGGDHLLNNRKEPMLHYTIVFLVVALIAGLLGFVGIAGLAAQIAKVLFFVFLILFIISLIMGRRPPA